MIEGVGDAAFAQHLVDPDDLVDVLGADRVVQLQKLEGVAAQPDQALLGAAPDLAGDVV